MSEGKHVLISGKLHRIKRDKGKNKSKLTTFRPGDRFDATKKELKAFGDLITVWTPHIDVEEVNEVEGSAVTAKSESNPPVSSADDDNITDDSKE